MDGLLGAILAALLILILADAGLDTILWTLGIAAWILLMFSDDPPTSD